MPMQWVEPQRLGVVNKDVFVYHAYKNASVEEKLSFHYTTSYIEDDHFEFDVRDIDSPTKAEQGPLDTETYGSYLLAMEARNENHLKVIAHGVKTGQVEVDEDNNG